MAAGSILPQSVSVKTEKKAAQKCAVVFTGQMTAVREGWKINKSLMRTAINATTISL